VTSSYARQGEPYGAEVSQPRPSREVLPRKAELAELDFCVAGDPVDELIAADDAYDFLPAERSQIVAALAAPFLEHHRNGSRDYDRWVAKAKGVSPSDPTSFPPIATTVFKAAEVLSVPAADVAKWCVSSGTLGIQSRVGRDRTTLDRMMGCVRSALSLIRQWHEEELQVLHLGPANEEAGDIWFPYLMSLTELLYPTEHLMVGRRLETERAREMVGDLMASRKHIGIIGAPFAVTQLCESIRDSGDRLQCGDRLTVVVGGGWKRHTGIALEKPAFRRLVCEAFGLSDDGNVRDAFNQVELNSLMLECVDHRMHIPPWVHAFTRAPDTLEPLPNGMHGLISFVDLSVSSYPCTIVGDDLGRVHDGPCTCGRPGPLLEVIRRVDRGFQRGCALALDNLQESTNAR
jgi:long-chain-fatty-acid---luciferin-component ligase